MKSIELVVGDKVTWTSQAQGFTKTKVGTVVQVVNPGNRPALDQSPGMSRNHKSYVIEVPNKSGRGKAKRYWPVVSLLSKA